MGDQFVRMSLRDLGLQVQLGHIEGSLCINPKRAGHTFVVMDTNRLHEVEVNYCACDCRGGANRRQQLLRFRWYPASLRQPQTCATLALLDHFHSLTLASKISAYDFYKSLTHATDAMGLRVSKVSSYRPGSLWDLMNLHQSKYKCFLWVVCQFRHLKLLLCVGRGQEEDGVACTAEGELAIHCAAGPIPDVNLLSGWIGCLPEKR